MGFYIYEVCVGVLLTAAISLLWAIRTAETFTYENQQELEDQRP